jgi:hypothetical protein
MTCVAVATMSLAIVRHVAAEESDVDVARADRHFRRGVELAKSGDFGAAAVEFQAAQGLRPHPSVLYNLAQAYTRSGRPVEALQAIEAYRGLAASGDDANRSRQLEELTTTNEGRVGWVNVTLPLAEARLLVDGRRPAASPDGRIPLSAGVHALVVYAPGHEVFEAEITIEPRQTTELTPTLVLSEVLPPARTPAPECAPCVAAPRPSDRSSRRELVHVPHPNWWRVLVISGSALSLAGATGYLLNTWAFDEWEVRHDAWATRVPRTPDAAWLTEGRRLDEERSDLQRIDMIAIGVAALGFGAVATGLTMKWLAPQPGSALALRANAGVLEFEGTW